MIAAAVTGPMHSAIPPAGLIPTQNILLVHWNKAETDRLTRNLGDLYRLRPVRTETQLLTALEDPSIQLILINAEWDYRQDSIRICSRLKSLPAFAHIAVIFLIPAGDLDARIASLRSGADAWIERPLSPDYLRAQINALLTNRRRLKSYFTRPEPDPHPIATTLNDPSFLNRLRTMILRHLPDPDLNVDVLARLMNVSRPTLYRKLRSLSDRTPNEWVNLIRLIEPDQVYPFVYSRVPERA